MAKDVNSELFPSFYQVPKVRGVSRLREVGTSSLPKIGEENVSSPLLLMDQLKRRLLTIFVHYF